jgi:signal peptidase I
MVVKFMEMVTNMKNSKKYITIAAIAPFLFYFWPSSLGGNTDFISVYGDSMKPAMENGALAILKKDAVYNDRDIVAYHYSEMGLSKVVIHRIMGKAADGNFVLKGDNNRSNDPETVRPDQIIGKLFFHIPYVGYLPLVMKQPLVLVLTMMALAFFAMVEKNRKNAGVKDALAVQNSVKKEVAPIKKTKERKKETEKRMKQISLFVPALILNMAYYILGQYLISVGILPLDGYTAFLVDIIDPYLAGTIVFSSWFAAIIGSYIASRYSISLEYKKSANVPSGTVQLNYRRLLSIKPIAQLFWIIFTGVYGLYFLVLISKLW